MRVLIVEDQAEIATLLAEKVLHAGFAADIVGAVAEARAAIEARDYSVMLLDRRLPDGDGVSIIRSAREGRPNMRVLMLTAMRGIDEMIDGLDAGADDYLTKPFDPEELMARIRAVLRRPGPQTAPSVRVGALSFELEEQRGFVNGRLFLAPKLELVLLGALMRRAGLAVTRADLLDEIYGGQGADQADALKMLIHRLRQRLKNQSARADIHAARGIGYLIRSAEE
ncbi:response regulator transcription factor [Methylosinus sp. H3A]|uniref:response regulator transcription factor n=1 Tax=Methylosinus sp. H3A TaxID=2785786 RepID=UPI0018C2A341|nr:response regulator transcription factor [Methylosinus sp. H3A]MBG0809376.1 response regulator transcription factor [Methylosinus sp. H3A]